MESYVFHDFAVVAMGHKRKLSWTGCCPRRNQYKCNESRNHGVIKSGTHKELLSLAPLIEEAYAPCPTSYLDAKGQWNVSCYAELCDIPDAIVPGAVEHAPMKRVLEPILDDLTTRLCKWWQGLHPEFDSFELRRVQTFVTRYRPQRGETHLTRHVDGPHVDASCILQLHSPQGFAGGGLRVWDATNQCNDYALDTGDLCMLDHMVWHQSNAVTSGERWVLVIFCQKQLAAVGKMRDPCKGEELVSFTDSEPQRATCQTAISLATLAASTPWTIDQAHAKMLIGMLSSSSNEERERSAFAIGCLAASCDSNQIVLVDSGALPLLVDLLGMPHHQYSKLRAWAAAALCRLASNNLHNKGMIVQLGAVESLVGMLTSGQDMEVEEAASALCNLAANHEGNKRVISVAGAIPPLLTCLEGAEQKQRLWSAAALANLAADPACAPVCRSCGHACGISQRSVIACQGRLSPDMHCWWN